MEKYIKTSEIQDLNDLLETIWLDLIITSDN